MGSRDVLALQKFELIGAAASESTSKRVKEEREFRVAMACRMQGEEEENARDRYIASQSRHSIYTKQSSVIYKWPSEIIESKCK